LYERLRDAPIKDSACRWVLGENARAKTIREGNLLLLKSVSPLSGILKKDERLDGGGLKRVNEMSTKGFADELRLRHREN